jgi:hypothetical protein
MKVFRAVAMIALLAGPAYAQTAPVQRAGEEEKDKSPAEIEAERQAERAYKRSLSNVPDAVAPADPWGNVRSDGAPKTAVKQAPVKRAKPATPPN